MKNISATFSLSVQLIQLLKYRKVILILRFWRFSYLWFLFLTFLLPYFMLPQEYGMFSIAYIISH